MPSRKKQVYSDGPNWYRNSYNESNSQLSTPTYYDIDEFDEDTWSRDDFLFKDNLHEVLSKWENLDEGIWGKIICLERNRRVAKAYTRYSKLTINNSNVDFDGHNIGLNGFDNPSRTQSTETVLNEIGSKGLVISTDGKDNVWAQHNCKCLVHSPECVNRPSMRNSYSTAIGKELQACQGQLSPGKAFKLFDMNRFHQNVNKELSSTYPDMASLQLQCVSVISFGKSNNILESPVSILIINISALKMLRLYLRPMKCEPNTNLNQISNTKPAKESFKTVAGSVWQSVRKFASRSSSAPRNSLSDYGSRPWSSSTTKLTKDENIYSSIASTVTYAEPIYEIYGTNGPLRPVPNGNNKTIDRSHAAAFPINRLTYSDLKQFRYSTMGGGALNNNIYNIYNNNNNPTTAPNHKCSTLEPLISKPPEPKPDYDESGCSSSSTSDLPTSSDSSSTSSPSSSLSTTSINNIDSMNPDPGPICSPIMNHESNE